MVDMARLNCATCGMEIDAQEYLSGKGNACGNCGQSFPRVVGGHPMTEPNLDLDLDEMERKVDAFHDATRDWYSNVAQTRRAKEDARLNLDNAIQAFLSRLRAAERERDEWKTRAESIAKERNEARLQLARWPEAVAKVRALYPEDVFLPNGESETAKAAQVARLICAEITRLATERREGEKA